MDFLAQWVPAGKSPMCGNSICQDRRFLHRLMPRLERFFHYRNLDVSTIKELARRWAPDVSRGFSKDSSHTALSDVRDSIAELRYYRPFMGRLAGHARSAVTSGARPQSSSRRSSSGISNPDARERKA